MQALVKRAEAMGAIYEINSTLLLGKDVTGRNERA